MARFPSLTFTEAGMKMMVQAQNRHTLTFTKGKLGSGALTDSDDITKFTDLKAPKMELPVVKKDDSQKEKIALTFNTSNTALEEGFVSRELGIFAKLDDGAETLYAYSNAGNDYDYIPNKDTPTDENRLVVNLIVSSSANINVLVDGSIVYAHMSDLEDRLQVTATADKPASMSDRGLWVEIKDGLKSILHRWNKTTKSYETIHPETESAQVTDWNQGIVNTLASTALGSLVNTLTSDSLLASMIKKVLTATGVKYNIAQNGYICFGSFFGGLIIQWGSCDSESYYEDITFPVTFCDTVYVVHFNDATVSGATKRDDVYPSSWNIGATTVSKARMLCLNSGGIGRFTMIAIGK